MSPKFSQRFKFAAKLSSIHLLISLAIASLMAALVFWCGINTLTRIFWAVWNCFSWCVRLMWCAVL